MSSELNRLAQCSFQERKSPGLRSTAPAEQMLLYHGSIVHKVYFYTHRRPQLSTSLGVCFSLAIPKIQIFDSRFPTTFPCHVVFQSLLEANRVVFSGDLLSCILFTLSNRMKVFAATD